MGGSVRVMVFGSAAGLPTERRGNSAIGVWRGDELYLIDSGEPTAAYFARRGISPEALRAVFITHGHADHIGGLPMLLQWHQLSDRRGPLAAWLPREALPALRDFLNALYLLPELLGFEFELRSILDRRVYDDGGVVVEAKGNDHLEQTAARARATGYPARGESFSYRVRVGGKGIYFSGDLAEPGEAAEGARGADLAFVELAHFTPEELGEALAGTEVGRVVVNHLIHTLEPVEAEIPGRIKAAGFGGEVHVARDGDEFEV